MNNNLIELEETLTAELVSLDEQRASVLAKLQVLNTLAAMEERANNLLTNVVAFEKEREFKNRTFKGRVYKGRKPKQPKNLKYPYVETDRKRSKFRANVCRNRTTYRGPWFPTQEAAALDANRLFRELELTPTKGWNVVS